MYIRTYVRMYVLKRVVAAQKYMFNKFVFRLLNGVVEVYRAEQWWDNLTAILLRFLRYIRKLCM